MGSFKERFGLQPSGALTKGSSAGNALSEEALFAYGIKILNMLKDAQSGMLLFDLADKISVRVDRLMPVIDRLVSQGSIERVSRNKIGNDLLKITPKARN